MTRIRFEDLPSTNTPRNAENLNKLNNVVISPTEPTTGEEVWIQKGKNLISSFKNNWHYNLEGYFEYNSYGFSTTDYIDVEFGSTYVFSHQLNHSGGSILSFDANYNYLETINLDNILNPFTITNPDCKKVAIMSWDPNNNTTVNETWMQLEVGNTVTEYEPYIERKIYTKNDNNTYEKLLNADNTNNQQNYLNSEQVIGTWMGKPLYRQIIITTTPSTTEDSIVATIPNNAFARKIEGLMYNDTTSQLVPINFHYSEQYNCVTYIQFDGIHMKVSTSDYTDKQLEIILEYTKTTD